MAVGIASKRRVLLKRSSFCWLTQSSILIRTHLHPNRLQDLLNTHVAVPGSHRREFARVDVASFGIHTVHVDFGNKLDVGRTGRVIVRAVDEEFVPAVGVLRL